MKQILLDDLYNIWFKMRHWYYRDRLSFYDLYYQYLKDGPHIEKIVETNLKEFRNIYDLFRNHGWQVI